MHTDKVQILNRYHGLNYLFGHFYVTNKKYEIRIPDLVGDSRELQRSELFLLVFHATRTRNSAAIEIKMTFLRIDSSLFRLVRAFFMTAEVGTRLMVSIDRSIAFWPVRTPYIVKC